MSKHYAVLPASAPITTVKVGVRSVPSPFDGEIRTLVFSVGAANTFGASTFDVKLNGVSIFATPDERPVIETGQRSVVVTGLATAVSEDNIISWDALIVPLGGLAAPVTCTVVLDDLTPPTVLIAEESGEALTALLLRVADGDLEELEDGAFRIRTASDVVLPTTLPPSGAASGDLEDAYPGPTVMGLQGDALPATVAHAFIKRNAANSAWEGVGYGSTANTVVQGNDARLSDARVPAGDAGGDVEGSYPDALVVKSWKGRAFNLPDIAGFIEDDFADNEFNESLWLRSSSSDVAEQNFRLEVRNSNWFQTNSTFDFTNKWIAWEQEVDVWARLHFDNNNYLEFRVSTASGSIRFLLHTPGGDADQASAISYSGISHYKFEYQSGDSKIHWLTSGDGVTWTDRASVTAPVSIAACWLRWFGLAGDGTFRSVDNVTSNVPSADAITELDGYVWTWVQGNNRFELKPLPPNAVPVVSSAPSGAPAGHVAGFAEMRYDVVHHKLYLWNENTSAWDWKSIDNS